MLLKILQGITLLASLTLTTSYAADLKHWQDFEAKKIPLMQHIQELCMASDKEALAYFLATGGKYGFRKEPPTDFEYTILVQALAVTTTLYHNSKEPDLNLVQVRRQYGLKTEDALVQSHLIKEQSIVGYTLCMDGCLNVINLALMGQIQPDEIIPNHVQTIAALTSTCYLEPLKALSSKPAENTLKEFYKKGITVRLIQTIASALYIQPKVNDKQIVWIQSLVQKAFSPQQPTKPQFLRIALPSGRILERRADGGLFLDSLGISYGPVNVDNIVIDPQLPDDVLLTYLGQFGIRVFYGPEED